MPCNCRDKKVVHSRPSTAAGMQAGSQMMHTVYRSDGTSTGRQFTSLLAAQRYASGIESGAFVVST